MKMRLAMLGASVVLSILTGCVINSESDDGYYREPIPTLPSTPAQTEPLLAIVDSNQTMNADPGQGVGVFVEYDAGGHWNLWWTCDTAISGLSCNFNLKVTAESGEFANISSDHEAGDNISAPDASTISALTTTNSNLVRVTFDSAPGAIIRVDATVSGAPDPAIFFFVQDGKVRGDYKGALTNPMRFRGSTP